MTHRTHTAAHSDVLQVNPDTGVIISRGAADVFTASRRGSSNMTTVTAITCFNCHAEIDAAQLVEVRSKSAARSRARKTAARFPWNMSQVPSMLRLDDYQIVTRCVCAGACYRSGGGSDDSDELVEGIDFPHASDMI